MITLHTNQGDITIELDFDKTPKTAANFVKYAKEGFYNGTIFHRVISNFMIQGGGFDTNMSQKKTERPVENEAKTGGLNKIGTVAMARTSDPHSATAQFFINVANNDFLNFKNESENGWGYCVFGTVTSGMDVVDKIKKAKTTSKMGHQDVPMENIVIEKVTVTEKEKA